ncbi:MAG: peptidoglycan editing factor PgeF [Sulfurimonas sp.]|nr:peptidoglycan editing factor PgeF [Sulfurimonas sp.]
MKIIQSKLLNNFTNLIHGITTTKMGNLAFHINDNPQNVNIKHENLACAMNYKKKSLIHMKQIHSCDVHIVNNDDNFQSPRSCDALVTNKRNTPLMVMVADCSPILFYDKKEKIIAVAHAGRQGAFKNIVKNIIKSMVGKFNSKTENIYVSIGASIGVCCYEVGEEIYEEAKNLGLEYSLEKRNSNYYLDISKILKKQLLASGIKEKNIEISNECTCCKNNKYYSYRANPKTGRFAGVIMLK